MNLNDIAVEIICQWCSRSQGYALASDPPPQNRRCVHCGGRILAELLPGRPQDYGVAVSVRVLPPEPEPPSQGRHCQECGEAVGAKAKRCRRCYIRHRYAAQSLVRAKQLALQAQWRARRRERLVVQP